MERPRRRRRVVNLSLGAPFAWPQSPDAQAANQRLVDGIVVVASTGNNRELGLWAAGAPGVGERVIGTASVENTAIAGPAFEMTPHDAIPGTGLVAFTEVVAAAMTPTIGTFPVARTGTMTTPDDACSALPPGSLAGQIALVRRGTCGFFVKATNVQAAGAVGAVLYNNVVGALNPTVAGTTGDHPPGRGHQRRGRRDDRNAQMGRRPDHA